MFDIDDGTYATFTDEDEYSNQWTSRSSYYSNIFHKYSDVERKKWWKEQVNSILVPSFINDLDLKYAVLKSDKYNKITISIASKKSITEFERKMLFYSIKREHAYKLDCDMTKHTIVNAFPRLFHFSLSLEDLLTRFSSLGCSESDFMYIINSYKNISKDEIFNDMKKILKL